MFSLSSFLTMFLGGLDIPDISDQAAAWLKEKGAEYPDIKDRADALAVWLQQTIAEANPELEPEKMANTLKGIAQDIVSGTAGVDPGAHHGMF